MQTPRSWAGRGRTAYRVNSDVCGYDPAFCQPFKKRYPSDSTTVSTGQSLFFAFKFLPFVSHSNRNPTIVISPNKAGSATALSPSAQQSASGSTASAKRYLRVLDISSMPLTCHQLQYRLHFAQKWRTVRDGGNFPSRASNFSLSIRLRSELS